MSAFSRDIGSVSSWTIEASRRMNRMYRRLRHIYGGMCRYYHPGRDQMIAELRPNAAASVLEIGCGTGRNLVPPARLYPAARFFGIDISTEMQTSAIAKASLRRWLALFDVTPRDDLECELSALAAHANASVRFEKRFRGDARYGILTFPLAPRPL